MCFLLYAATSAPIPRRAWVKENPVISVVDLAESKTAIRAHFSLPEVQYIGSDTSCGCGFPNAMYQNGGWPEIEWSERDAETLESDRRNLGLLGALLKSLDEPCIELYGVWAGDEAEAPVSRESLSINDILKDSFIFKERGFYSVRF